MKPDAPSDPPRQSLSLSRGELRYTDEGDGPCVVAIHGLPGSLRDFRWLASALNQHVRLLRFDLPGFGETAADLTAGGVDDLADVLSEALDALALERAVLLGHSFGTAFSVRTAHRHPGRVAGLALLGPIALRPHRGFRHFRGKAFWRRCLQTPVLRRVALSLLRRVFTAGGFRNVSDAEIRLVIDYLAGFDFARHREAIEALSVPVLIAYTRDDQLIEPELAEELVVLYPDQPHLAFEDGRHNMQKTRSLEIGEALIDWVHGLHHV